MADDQAALDPQHQVTARYWDREHFSQTMRRAEWQNHPLSHARFSQILGHPTREEWFLATQLAGKRAERALGVGVGTAQAELQLLARGGVERFDLYDLSSSGLDAARAEAARLGVADRITCHVEDINRARLPADSYDVITFMASLHHVEELRTTLQTCYRALKPGGCLWAWEYVGPNHFDYPPEHTALARHLFHGLDPRLRKSWEPSLRFPTVQEVITNDPTESAHSAEILEALKGVFPLVDVTPLYGSFAFIMFWGLNHDAIYELPEGEELVRAILMIDELMIDAGKIPTYFANIVAHKPTRRQELARRFGVDPYGLAYRLAHAARTRLGL